MVMQGMVNPRTCLPNTTPSPQPMHKSSHVISKFKPKIRIIHIFAPEIIKTDVANFQELVQRLTGKPTERKSGKKKSQNELRREESKVVFCNPAKTFEFDNGFQNLGCGERIKEEEMWIGDNSSGCFGGFGDLDGFVSELNGFPLLPLNASHMDLFRETHFS